MPDYTTMLAREYRAKARSLMAVTRILLAAPYPTHVRRHEISKQIMALLIYAKGLTEERTEVPNG